MNWAKPLSVNKQDCENPSIVLLPGALELDKQWSFVSNKSNQRWLRLALNNNTSEVLTYTFGDSNDAICNKLKHFVPMDQHEENKRHAQKIEPKFLTLRTIITRLSRKKFCFSKSKLMHDTVISLFINRAELQRNVRTTSLMRHNFLS